MALIKCPECGNMISDKAAKCPKCGTPLGSQRPPEIQQPPSPQPPPPPLQQPSDSLVTQQQPYRYSPTPLSQRPSGGYPKEDVESSSSNGVLYAIIAMLVTALLGVGGYMAWKSGGKGGEAKTEPPVAQAKDLDPVVQNLINNMVKVEGGTFTMGATPEQGYGDNDERPTHQVTLSSFSIGRYEVTQEEWKAVMGTNPASFNGDKCPVEFVSWNDCQAFIQKLNVMTDMKFRMPTEAEWEFAARGGNKSQGYQFAGGNNLYSVGWHASNSGSRTKEVGQKSPNELGLYDMTGNLWEWCSDWYGSYSGGSQTNPIGPGNGTSRVLRGGGWNGGAKNCRISNRDGRLPNYSSDRLGLRLAL